MALTRDASTYDGMEIYLSRRLGLGVHRSLLPRRHARKLRLLSIVHAYGGRTGRNCFFPLFRERRRPNESSVLETAVNLPMFGAGNGSHGQLASLPMCKQLRTSRCVGQAQGTTIEVRVITGDLSGEASARLATTHSEGGGEWHFASTAFSMRMSLL